MQDSLNLTDQVIADRYRVLSPLGEGAMGAVFLAMDTQLRREVALKVLRKEWAMRPDVQRRLENECRILARLGPHTNIVTLYDRLTYEGNAVLVMEYVPGETLSDILVRTRSMSGTTEASRQTTPVAAGMSVMTLETPEAVNIATQCLDALGFAHSKGILHRDIKPSNIIVMRDYNGNLVAKVMDFGIGKALHDTGDDEGSTALTRAGGPGPGTPAYMAPEQIDPERFGPVGNAADLYALGITLYEMISLNVPFQGTYSELLHAHTNVEPPDPRDFSPRLSVELSAVVAKALRKDPRQRYQSAEEFRVDLQAAGSGTGTVFAGPAAGRTRVAPVPPRGRRLKTPLLAGLAAAMALIVAVAIFYGFNFSGETEPSTPITVPPVAAPAPQSIPTPQPQMLPPALPVQEVEGARRAAEEEQAAAQQRYKAINEEVGSIPAYMEGVRLLERASQAQATGSTHEAMDLYAKSKASFATAVPAPKAVTVEPALAPPAPDTTATAVAGPPDPPAASQAPPPQPAAPKTPAPGASVSARARQDALRASEDAKKRFEAESQTVDANENFLEGQRRVRAASEAERKGNHTEAERLYEQAQREFREATPDAWSFQ